MPCGEVTPAKEGAEYGRTELRVDDAAPRPRMARADDRDQFVGEQRRELDARCLLAGLGDDGDVDNNEMKDKQLEVSRKSFF